MFPPSNETPEPQPPDASPLTGVDRQVPFHVRHSAPLGCLAIFVFLALWIGSIAYMNPEAWYRSPTWNAENPPIPPGLLEAITREQRAVKRLQTLKCVTLEEHFDESAPNFFIVSPLEQRVSELTEGGTVIPVRWEVIVNDLIEAEKHFDDIAALRHRESIQIQLRSVTDSTPRIILRLPDSVSLMLYIEATDAESPSESDYQLLAGLPFTDVVVLKRPLSRSLSPLLPGFPKLDYLGLAYCDEAIADEVWSDVARCERLSLIKLVRVPVSDNGMKTIATIPRLKKLYFDGVRLEDQGLMLLPATLELDWLSVFGISRFDDLYLGGLHVDPVELNLYRTGVKFRGTGLDWLLSRKRLKNVSIPDFDLSRDEAKAINALGGPQIETTSPCF
jgi:hypothetical protein